MAEKTFPLSRGGLVDLEFTPNPRPEIVQSAAQWAAEITPTTDVCLGEDCRYKGPDELSCQLTTHHTIYPKANVSRTRRETLIYSRRSIVSKIMVHRCRHDYIHEKEDPSPFPEEDVVELYAQEAKVIEDLGLAVLYFSEIEFAASTDGLEISNEDIQNYIQERSNFFEKRKRLIKKISGLRIIPCTVVTGALLELAPEEGQRRLEEHSEYSLPHISERSLKEIRGARKKQLRRQKLMMA